MAKNKGLEYHQRAQKINEDLKDNYRLNQTYYNVGRYYFEEWAQTKKDDNLAKAHPYDLSSDEHTIDLHKIYMMLFSPLEDCLIGIDRLYLIPAPEIMKLPLHCIYDGKNFLLEKYDRGIAYLFSIEAFQVKRRGKIPEGDKILIVDNPTDDPRLSVSCLFTSTTPRMLLAHFLLFQHHAGRLLLILLEGRVCEEDTIIDAISKKYKITPTSSRDCLLSASRILRSNFRVSPCCCYL